MLADAKEKEDGKKNGFYCKISENNFSKEIGKSGFFGFLSFLVLFAPTGSKTKFDDLRPGALVQFI